MFLLNKVAFLVRILVPKRKKRKKVKKMRDDAEKSKSTLGDIDALSSLKGKMDE